MQKVSAADYWLTAVLLGFGFLIFFYSLYLASLAGLRRQLGVVGGDLSQSIDNNLLYREVAERGRLPQCHYWKAVLAVPRYIFSSGEDKFELGRELAAERVNCSINYVLSGNTERGVYTMIKALRYEAAGMEWIASKTTYENNLCRAYKTDSSLELVEDYLNASTGNARSIIEREYAEVARLKLVVREKCGI